MRHLVDFRSWDKSLNESALSPEGEKAVDMLNKFFRSPGTSGDYSQLRKIYTHFKDGGKIEDLPKSNEYDDNLFAVYKRNYSKFTPEEFVELFLNLDKTREEGVS